MKIPFALTLMLLLTVSLPSLGADSTIHALPAKLAPDRTDLLIIDDGTHNWKVTVDALRSATQSTAPGDTYVTNITVINNITGSNAYFTNMYVDYFTNVIEYTQTTYSTNNYLNFITNQVEYSVTTYSTNNILNNITNQVFVSSNVFTTNAIILYLTNAVEYSETTYSTNNILNNITNSVLVSTDIYTTNITVNNITNNYLLTTNVTATGIVFPEYAWDGPTNCLVCGGTNRWTFTATSDCAITQLLAYAAGYANSALLSITNSAATNITIRWSAPIRIPYGYTSREYVLTNSDVIMFSADVAKYGSNVVPRGFGP